MARRKSDNLVSEIEDEVKQKISKDKIVMASGLFAIFFSVFLISSLFGMGGALGDTLFNFFTSFFGIYAYLMPLLAIVLATIFLLKKTDHLKSLQFILTCTVFISLFILLGFFDWTGRLGTKIATSLKDTIGTIPSIFLFAGVLIISVLKIFNADLSIFFKKRDGELDYEELPDEAKAPIEEVKSLGFFSRFFSRKFSKTEDVEAPTEEMIEEEDEYEEVDAPEVDDVRGQMFKQIKVDIEREPTKLRVKKEKAPQEKNNKKENSELLRQVKDTYRRPPLSLYTEDSGKPSAGDNKENARIIKRTLADFGISVEMDEVTVGPTVTRYALKPAQGVKIEKIMNLANNIALELGVPNVSIIRVHERSLIGIEVPNKTKSRLGLSNLFSQSEFLERKDKLSMTLGKDIYGEPVYVDLARMPHMLVAGTTGSGKSVLLHGIMHSLIYKNSPYDLKFILVDPKKVEFGLYAKLPHLYTQVIKDPKKAVQTLNWLVQEMDRRYAVLEEVGKQNIGAYHSYVMDKYKRAESKGESSEKLPEKMPYIVLVIDELADFMMKYPKEMEAGIVKLAQMSRAVGIHLILATQRPSTNVITGVIKGNVPARVALRVASQVDSRVIIDQGGAEKLLGYGDLLFVNSDGSDLRRIQSPNVTEEETKDVVAFLRQEYDDILTEELKSADGSIVGETAISTAGGPNLMAGEDDERYEEAKQIVIESKQASTSFLQRRMGLGYSRAAKMIDILEARGVISAQAPGNRQRKVLIGSDDVPQQAPAQKVELLKEDEPEDEVEEEEPEDAPKKDSSFFRF